MSQNDDDDEDDGDEGDDYDDGNGSVSGLSIEPAPKLRRLAVRSLSDHELQVQVANGPFAGNAGKDDESDDDGQYLCNSDSEGNDDDDE